MMINFNNHQDKPVCNRTNKQTSALGWKVTTIMLWNNGQKAWFEIMDNLNDNDHDVKE